MPNLPVEVIYLAVGVAALVLLSQRAGQGATPSSRSSAAGPSREVRVKARVRVTGRVRNRVREHETRPNKMESRLHCMTPTP